MSPFWRGAFLPRCEPFANPSTPAKKDPLQDSGIYLFDRAYPCLRVLDLDSLLGEVEAEVRGPPLQQQLIQ
ncbi:UNVERIFIED_CONTAM: hypothetical protein Slati_0195100 [Sesamum latifolium]|uniref:Uncharacterized protein n=1 Tax=Sesamum latifolium TaxID=2727402 RepID=A0AAW2YB67_9LAMI